MIEASTSTKNFAVTLRGLATLDARVLQAGKKGLEAGLEDTIGHIRRNKLLGQVLNRRTGQLIKSMEQRVDITSEGVVGRLGSNLPYAAVHEFGFKGVQNVRAHNRVIKALIARKTGNLTGKAAARRIRTGAVGFQQVKAHARKVNFKARAFTRTGLADRLPVILRRIERELKTAAEAT